MTTRAELSIGEALVGLLEAYGVDTIFGIPGVHNIEMYRALPRSKINHILPRHEQGAGFMADGYARATGKPGVCFTISGPGVTNILTPMGQAWSDSSNVLVVSTALDVVSAAQGRGRLHEMISQLDSAKSVTHFARRAYTAQDVQDAFGESFARFASARPRPAYVEIPLDVLSQPAGSKGWFAAGLPSYPQALETQVQAAIKKLNGAKKPCIVLGGGAQAAGASALKIAELLNAPIITTVAGKGVVPASHPLVWGAMLQLEASRDLLTQSDCILAVGTELSETDFWVLDFAIEKNLIRIDIDPASLGRPHSAEIAILADATSTLARISAGVTQQKNVAAKPPATENSELRQMMTKLLDVIREALPENTVVVSDMTQIAYAGNEVFPVSQPRSWIHPSGFGTLGFALPTAIGAKFGVPHKPVVALAGDYGLQYTLNELGTAVEHKQSLPILLWNNDALGQIRDNMVGAGIQPNAVTLKNPDFMALAKAYGAWAERPENLAALAIAIKAALKADGPTIIEMTPRMFA
ncbi:5-guanidino-2-oxopentanoate decarboxylase [Aestuariivirga litoralis]|uniref:5-guanidino-2-oxopentanoate decarboxylase n=1 Tax=Aestuariivirga litoralis TaxID=2650924 RepID=UPI0018C7F627|nr:5-guanidino-2-oxopentanoate decarboxylase [Aestuariivirga litoralis]MBG1232826.1 5-guanidino-2-oxopentanoate decarboxylase [Aestuariivirga litoralis]